MKNLRTLTTALALAALVLAGCSSGGSSGSGGQGGSAQPSATTAAAADRPRSTAKLSILAPRNGQVVNGGDNLSLKVGLTGAKIVQPTTTKIQPDQGHLHVMLDGKLISMNYQLFQKLPKLGPGAHQIQVEFVAADHLPFDPRVLTQAAFQVNG